MNDEKNNLVLTIKEIMEILNIGRVTAYKLIKSDELKAAKIAGKYRTTRSALYEYIEKSINSTDFSRNHIQCYNTVDCFYGTREIPNAERSEIYK